MSAAENKAVFLSYASQDAEAAKRICDALRAFGAEVWFDQNELVGGDAWDAKIRKQIAECALFVPVISAATQARREGYFRLEWRIAAQRTHMMSEQVAFLLPVVIDATRDAEADVPAEFKAVQWTRLLHRPAQDLRPADEAMEKFCARGKQLLGGAAMNVGPVADRAPGQRPGLQPTRAFARLWRLPAIIAVALLVVVAAFFALRPRRNPGEIAKPTAPAQSAAPRSAAQKLAAQAETLIADDFNSTRENYQLAEELCRKALAADAGDAEIWAFAARISFDQIFRSYDMSDHRLEVGREQAQRALKLDPSSSNAGLAVASYHRLHANLDEAERMQRDLMGREPANRRVLRLGADLARARGNDAAVTDFLARLQALPGGDPVSRFTEAHHLINAGRYGEAGALLDRVIAKSPGRLPCYEKFYLLVRGWADYEAAQKFLAEIPAQFLDEDSFVAMAARMGILTGDGDAALKTLQRVPREFLEEFGNSEPKGFIAGWAQKIAGRPAAATLEWQQALAQVETRLAADRKNLGLLELKAQLQASLGEQEPALATMRLCLELGGERTWSRGLFQLNVLAMTGETTAAIAAVETQWPTLPFHLRSYLRADLARAPSLAAIRDDPRVQRLIAEHSAALEKLKLAAGATAKMDAKSAPADKSVAVLAFANLSDDKANEYFSDGISEELLNVLAKVPGLKVSARTSAFYFKGKQVPMAEIAQQLGVAYVVEGSVRKQGDKVRITAQLIKAADGFHVWSDTFTRDLKDVFAVQDEIAGLIAQQLQLKLGSSKPARTVNPEAHGLVLEGRYFWNQRNEDAYVRAEAVYLRALELDPEYAEAHAGLADVWAIRGWYRIMPGNAGQAAADFARAKEEVRRAQALNPALAEPYATLGVVLLNEFKFAESERQFAQAIALNPNYAVARHWHACLLDAVGHLDESLREIEQSLSLDPLSPNALWQKANSFMFAGRLREALDAADRALALRPVHPTILSTRAKILWALGRRDEAIAAARAVGRDLTAQPRWFADANAIDVLRQAGLQSEAEAYAERVLANVPKDDYRYGTTLVALGRGQEALTYLRTLPASGLESLYWHSMWDSLREDAQFRQWLVKLGCAEQYKLARETQARMLKEQEAKK